MSVDSFGTEEEQDKVAESKPNVESKATPNRMEACWFDIIPEEIIQYIFSFLTFDDYYATSLVCKKFYDNIHDPLLWQKLDFSFRKLNPAKIEIYISKAPLLKELNWHGLNSLPLSALEQIAKNCPLLQKLDIGFVEKLTMDHFEIITKSFHDLRWLNVEGCEDVRDEMLLRLCSENSIPFLEHLNLSHCVISECSTIATLAARKPFLSQLNIDGIPWITDSAILELCKHRGSQLTELFLDGAELTDESIIRISQTCSMLKVLSISFAENMTSNCLSYIKRMTTLQTLIIRKGFAFHGAAVGQMFTFGGLQKLKYLDLSECADLSDNEIDAIVQCCGKKLKVLILNWCWNVTDEGLKKIIDICNDLERLELLGLDKIEGHCLVQIPVNQKKLVKLDLRQCNMIIDVLLFSLVRLKHDLIIWNYYGEEICFCTSLICEVPNAALNSPSEVPESGESQENSRICHSTEALESGENQENSNNCYTIEALESGENQENSNNCYTIEEPEFGEVEVNSNCHSTEAPETESQEN